MVDAACSSSCCSRRPFCISPKDMVRDSMANMSKVFTGGTDIVRVSFRGCDVGTEVGGFLSLLASSHR